MQNWLAVGLICLASGIPLGMLIQGKLLKPLIGDQYEINKPKVRGEGNTMLIEQENEDNTTPDNKKKEKKKFFSKIFKRKNK